MGSWRQLWISVREQPVRTMRDLTRQAWRQWRPVIFFFVFVVVPVKSSLADWNWVPTGSMNPTILEGDLIYVDKLAYDLRLPLTLHRLARWSEPETGDIVVCLSPEDGTRLVKRVVGTPGDTLELRSNVLFLNGQRVPYHQGPTEYRTQLPSPLAEHSVLAMEDLGGAVHPVLSVPGVQAMRSFGPMTIPEGHYFLMGDNRDLSRDSRFFGLVPRASILGQARAVVLSFNITDKYQPRLGRFFDRLQ